MYTLQTLHWLRTKSINQSINVYLSQAKAPPPHTHTHPCTKHNHNIQ